MNGGSDEIHYSSPGAGLDLVQSDCPRRALLCLRRAASPPRRGAVRIARMVSVKTADRTQLMQLADLSITGARIFGVPPALPGTPSSSSCQTFASRQRSSVEKAILRGRLQPLPEVAGCRDPAFLFRRVFKAAWLNSGFARRGVGRPKGVRLTRLRSVEPSSRGGQGRRGDPESIGRPATPGLLRRGSPSKDGRSNERPMACRNDDPSICIAYPTFIIHAEFLHQIADTRIELAKRRVALLVNGARCGIRLNCECGWVPLLDR